MKKNIFLILIITVLTLSAWFKIYSHSFQGEGYYFFDTTLKLRCDSNSFVGVSEKFLSLCRYDNLGRLTYYLFKNVFFDNLKVYLSFAILTQILLSFCLLFLVWQVTRNKFVAFLAGIFFSTNYVTNFEMISLGNYQWFATRVPNFVFTLVSMIFFYQFLLVNKYSFYFLSLILFLFSVLMAHISMFFLPLFIFLVFFNSLFKYKSKKEFLSSILKMTPFIIGTLFIVSHDSFSNMDGGFVSFLLRFKFDILKETLFQLTMVTIPYDLLVFILNYLREWNQMTIKSALEILYLPVLLFYFAVIFLAFKFKKRWGVFLLASFLSMFSMGVFNLYTNRVTFIYQITSSRYYFPLGFLISPYLAVVAYLIFWRKNLIFRSLLAFFIIFWIYSNIKTIWVINDENQYKHIISHNVRRYIKNISSEFRKDSLVILPKEIGPHEASFLKYFYGKDTMNFTSIVILTEREAKKFDPKKDFLIEYDKKKGEPKNLNNKYIEIFKANNLIR